MALLTLDIVPNALAAWLPFYLKEHLKSAGWVVRGSGDGTSYNPTGDLITHGGSGAGGWGNTNAWVRLLSPGAAPQLVIQRAVNDAVWRIKVGIQDFGAGAPSATQVPATAVASDEFILLGGGTDAAPTGTSWFGGGTAGGMYLKGAVDPNPPYGFWFAAYVVAGVGTPNPCVFILDPLSNAIAGDAFPYVCIARSTDMTQSTLTGSDTPANQYSYVASATPSVSTLMPALYYGSGSQIIVPRDLPSTQAGLARAYPLRYERRAAIANPGYKGLSTMIKLLVPGVLGRWTPLSIDSPNDHLVYGDVCMPWGGDYPRS